MEQINKILDSLIYVSSYKEDQTHYKLNKLDKLLKIYMKNKHGEGVVDDNICIGDFKTLMINAIQNEHDEIRISQVMIPSMLYEKGYDENDIKKYINDYIKLPKIDGLSYIMHSIKHEYIYNDCKYKYIYIINPYKESDVRLFLYNTVDESKFNIYKKYRDLGNKILEKYYEEKGRIIQEYSQKYIEDINNNNEIKI